MKKLILPVIFFLFLAFFSHHLVNGLIYAENPKPKSKENIPHSSLLATAYEAYRSMQLGDAGLDFLVFNVALQGYNKLKNANSIKKDIIAICDFSQASDCKRLYVIDVKKGELLFNTLVAHGKNSGEQFAQRFSNEPSSFKSSLGFFSTKETYEGKHGLSLKLNGLEPGINDNAEERAIVMHGADYVSEDFIRENGRLGRSFGCPSVPYELHEPIINTLKDGSCVFIYSPDKRYLRSSYLLK